MSSTSTTATAIRNCLKMADMDDLNDVTMDFLQQNLPEKNEGFEFELSIDNSADFDLQSSGNGVSVPSSYAVSSNQDAKARQEDIEESSNQEKIEARNNLCDIISKIHQEDGIRGDNSLPQMEDDSIDLSEPSQPNHEEIEITIDIQENKLAADNNSQQESSNSLEIAAKSDVVISLDSENCNRSNNENASVENVNNESSNFIEEEQSINLEEILKKGQEGDDSSDSEFEFDIPSKTTPPAQSSQKTPSTPAQPTQKTPSTCSQPENKETVLRVKTETKKEVTSKTQVVTMTTQVNSVSQSIVTTKTEPTPTPVTTSSNVSSVSIESSKPKDKVIIPEAPRQIIEGDDDKEDHEREPVPLALTRAQNEWENVQTIEAGYQTQGGKAGGGPKKTALISHYELEEYLQSSDFSSVKDNIKTRIERRGFTAFKHMLFGPPKLNRSLLDEKEKVFCIAASPLNNSDGTHMSALQTIYRCLTGSRFDCGRFGSHWEEIGFQGNDPSTDLRGAGLLGLVNLVHFLRDPKKSFLANDIYKLSLHPTQNFPFCVMGINLSRIALQALREDCLNKECNRRSEVVGVVNDLYVAMYLSLYLTWKNQGKTVVDSGFVIKDIETTAKKNPQKLLKHLEDYMEKKKGASKSPVNLDNMDIGGDTFFSVVDSDAGQY